MALDLTGIRFIVNGEPVDAEVLNRPTRDLKFALEAMPNEYYSKAEVDVLVADESIIAAIIFG